MYAKVLTQFSLKLFRFRSKRKAAGTQDFSDCGQVTFIYLRGGHRNSFNHDSFPWNAASLSVPETLRRSNASKPTPRSREGFRNQSASFFLEHTLVAAGYSEGEFPGDKFALDRGCHREGPL